MSAESDLTHPQQTGGQDTPPSARCSFSSEEDTGGLTPKFCFQMKGTEDTAECALLAGGKAPHWL